MDRAPLIPVNQRTNGSARTRIERLSSRFSSWLTIRPRQGVRSPRPESPLQLEESVTIDDWCRFPKLTCICPTTYEKLEDLPDMEVIRARAYNQQLISKPSTSKQFFMKKSPSKESKKQAQAGASTSGDDKPKEEKKYPIYTVKNKRHDVLIDDKLNGGFVTRLVSILEGVKEEEMDYHGIVEEWDTLGAERMLEDHEYFVPTWNCLKAYRRRKQDAIVKYRYRREIETKYAIFENPLAYLDREYLYPHALDPTLEMDQEALKLSMVDENWSPTLYSHGYFQDREHDIKYFLVLKFNSVYTFEDQDAAVKFLEATKDMTLRDKAYELQQVERAQKIEVVVRLQNYHVYKLVKETPELRSLNSIILRPVILENPSDKFPETVLSFDTDKERSCWLSAMRLAKYGKQLRANYKAFRNKHLEPPAFPGRSVDSMVPSGSEESKVAMDFTGPVSRVVDDPLEARAIAMNEGYRWKQRWRFIARRCCHVSDDIAYHLSEPWYHGPMHRMNAEYILGKPDIKEGTFLVRESTSGSREGTVISVKHHNKVHHIALRSMLDPQTGNTVYSIHKGTTRFCDITGLIEFYQMNKGYLPCRLSSHISKERVQQEAPEQAPVEAPEQAPMEVPEQVPVEAPEQASVEVPEQAPMEAPVEVPEQAPMEVVEQAPEEAPKEAPKEAPEKP